MLGNVLPGLRELRAPLAAGYLWLRFVWLVWGDTLRPVARSRTRRRSIGSTGWSRSSLASVLPSSPVLPPYILGSIVIDVQTKIGKRIADFMIGMMAEATPAPSRPGGHVRSGRLSLTEAGDSMLERWEQARADELERISVPGTRLRPCMLPRLRGASSTLHKTRLRLRRSASCGRCTATRRRFTRSRWRSSAWPATRNWPNRWSRNCLSTIHGPSRRLLGSTSSPTAICSRRGSSTPASHYIQTSTVRMPRPRSAWHCGPAHRHHDLPRAQGEPLVVGRFGGAGPARAAVVLPAPPCQRRARSAFVAREELGGEAKPEVGKGTLLTYLEAFHGGRPRTAAAVPT